MKNFESICKMTQMEVKAYMKEYLTSKKYKVIDEDGFLYAKGDVPVLLVAHMDTVHKEQCKEIKNENGKLSSPQGIGGDDRCGVFIIMNLVKEFHCSVLLCEDEEIGTIGARKFTKAKFKQGTDANSFIEKRYIDDLGVNYMIEFDRRGNNDAVFYSCDNKEFTDFVTDFTGFKNVQGSWSDISVLMPEAKIAAVNLSSGYYLAHTTGEYVVYNEMMDTIDAAKVLILADCDKPFKYVMKKYPINSFTYTKPAPKKYTTIEPKKDKDGMTYSRDLFDNPNYKDAALYRMAKKDKKIELEVIVYSIDSVEEVIYSDGDTKAECWMNLFMDNPDITFNDIGDYNWS